MEKHFKYLRLTFFEPQHIWGMGGGLYSTIK